MEPELVNLDYGDFLRPVFTNLNGGGWGRCTNVSGEVLLIYGPKHERDHSIFDTSPYFLPHGCTTPNDWDCDGFFVPKDRIVREPFRRRKGPLAIKFWDYRHFTVTSGSEAEYRCPISNGHFQPSQVNWPIPNFSYDELLLKRARDERERGCKTSLGITYMKK